MPTEAQNNARAKAVRTLQAALTNRNTEITALKLEVKDVREQIADARDACQLHRENYLRAAAVVDEMTKATDALNAQIDEATMNTAAVLLRLEESTNDQVTITRMIDDIDSALVAAGFNAGTVVDRVGRLLKLIDELKRERDDFALVAEDARAALAVEKGNVLVLRSMAEHAETALEEWRVGPHNEGAFEHTGIEGEGTIACAECTRAALERHVADALLSTRGDDEDRAADSIARAEVEHERDRLRAQLEDARKAWFAFNDAENVAAFDKADAELDAALGMETMDKSTSQIATLQAQRDYARNDARIARAEKMQIVTGIGADGSDDETAALIYKLRAEVAELQARVVDRERQTDDSVIVGEKSLRDLARLHHDQIERELQERLAAGTPQSSMSIQHGTDVHGMPCTRLLVDGVAVAHFGVKLKVEGGDVPR